MRIRDAFFSLTTEERKIVVFVLSAFVLGVSVKHCRDERRVPHIPPVVLQPTEVKPPVGPDDVPNPD